MTIKAILRLFVALAIIMGATGAAALASPSASIGESTAIAYFAAKAYQMADISGCDMRRPDLTHWYVAAYQCGQNLTGISATMTIPNPPPAMDDCNGQHSNGQIALVKKTGTGHNGIEVSWVVDSHYNGGKSYLQIGRAIGTQDPVNDYPSKDWVPNPKNTKSPQPIHSRIFTDAIKATSPEANLAATLSEDAANITTSPMKVSIRYSKADGGQWQVFVNDDREMIGYYPDKAFGPNGLHPNWAGWWGEVATTGACATTGTLESCTAMGNGKAALMRTPPNLAI